MTSVFYEDDHVQLWHGRWQDIVPRLPIVDAVISDPPYTSRVVLGYRKPPDSDWSGVPPSKGTHNIPYMAITEDEARSFAVMAVGHARNWVIAFNDHIGWNWIADTVAQCGWYTFAPVVWLKRDNPPRFQGDGPTDSVEYICVARPRRVTKCGSLPGYYDVQRCNSMTREHVGYVGQKPLQLMQRLVRDYTSEGDLILDPYAGTGSTGRAAKDTGRRAILIEMDLRACELAAKRLRPHRAWQQELEMGA